MSVGYSGIRQGLGRQDEAEIDREMMKISIDGTTTWNACLGQSEVQGGSREAVDSQRRVSEIDG